MTTAEQYKSTSTHLYDQAMVELDAGDLLQASEKLWGAAAQALKSVAERRGWKHNSHAQFYNIMADLEKETESPGLRRDFGIAAELHTNFYENWLNEDQIRDRSQDVFRFVNRVNGLP